MMKFQKITYFMVTQAIATATFASALAGTLFVGTLMSSTQAYGFEGPITVLSAEYGESFRFVLAPNVLSVKVPSRNSPHTLLNLKFCPPGPQSTFNCKQVIELATGRPLLSDLDSVQGLWTSKESFPFPVFSRDIFQSHNLSFLVKQSVFKHPQFKGIGLHRHIVGINSFGISASNIYGANDGGSFVPKAAINIAREVTLKSGETAYVVNFIVAHFYHKQGDSTATKTTMITFRPHVVIGDGTHWDKVDRDYYLFNGGGKGAFDRSSELLK